jgi:hypothetical protein
MGFNFPNIREMRQLQEAMLQGEKISQMEASFDIQNALDQQRSIERDLQLTGFQQLQDARDLHATLLANQLDMQEAAQEALEHQEWLEDVLGSEALEAAMDVAEQRIEASLDTDRIAEISEQLDLDYFALTLRQAQDLLISNAAADMLAEQADIQAIISEAEDALDSYPVLESGEFAGELAGGPPEWMRHLSRANLVALINLLSLLIETLGAAYGVSLLLPGENAIEEIVSDAEVQAVVAVLIVSLRWARYLLDNHKDD